MTPHGHTRNRRSVSWIAMALCVAWSVALTASTRAQESARQDSLLALIQALYDNGSFVSAELEARRLLDQSDVDDSARISAQQIIAFSLIAQGRPSTATEHFVSILKKDSTYALDPLMTSPKIMTVFEEAKRDYLQEKSGFAAPAREFPPPVPAGPSFRLIVFPGWDQMHQGRSTKGAVLLGAGGVALGSTVAFEFLRRSARDDYLTATTPDEASAKYRDYDRYYKAEYYSAAVFAAVYLYSAFDAFFDLPPRLDAKALPDGSGVQMSLAVPF